MEETIAITPAITRDTFVRTKLGASLASQGLLERPRLEAMRAAASRARLTTIVAPGGFGKTRLAASWINRWRDEGRLCAWLSLDRDDDEPSRFTYCLTQAVGEFGEGAGRSARALLEGSALAEPRTVISMLINDLEGLDREAFLALDDYHWISDPAINDAVAFLVSHAPTHLHLIITSRAAPKLPLARLRAHGEWLEIDASALRFDQDETRRFLEGACPQRLSSAQIARLYNATEGWAAALRIAALTRAPGDEAPAALGASRAFADLIEDLLKSWPRRLQYFMAATSPLERLNADLCNAVIGADDSAALLDQIVRGNLLIDPLGGDGHWLRYHQLLLDYLRGPLCQRLQIDTAQVHRRAANWFASHAMWTDAVRHALAGGDVNRAVEWIARCGMALVKNGDLMTLLAWRRQFPHELMRQQPEVRLAVVWGLTLAMRYGEAEPILVEIEEQALADGLPEAEREVLCAHCQAVRAVGAALRDDSQRALDIARRWRRPQGETDAWTANVVSNVLRFANWKAGDWVAVYEQPWEHHALEDDRRTVFSVVYREVLLGCVELDQARLGVAERHAREALRLAELHTGAQSVSSALAAPLFAAVAYERGQFGAAEDSLLSLMSLIDNTAMLESLRQAYLAMARIARAREAADHAYALLERAEAIGYNRRWDRLVSAILLERLKWLIVDGRLDEARACGVRLGRIAATQHSNERCARSDLHVYCDWGLAQLALADQRLDEACAGLARLYADARAARIELRAVQLGATFAIAHMASDRRDAAFQILRDVLRIVSVSGAHRSILDQGADILAMLPRFLVSDHCEPGLVPCVERLLADQVGRSQRSEKTARLLTEREHDVLNLVALGQSNKEIARALDLSAETVKTHLANTYAKLGAQRRAEAVSLARASGLLAQRPEAAKETISLRQSVPDR